MSEIPSPQNSFAHRYPAYRSLVLSLSPVSQKKVVFCNQGTVIDLDTALEVSQEFFLWTKEGFASYADRLNRPWAHVNGDYFLFNDWRPSQEDLSVLRRYGLNIFNYEPVFIHNPDGSWPWMPSQGQPHYPELEKISELALKYDISPVTVYLCEKGLGDVLKKQNLFPHLEFKDWNSYFLKIVDQEKKTYAPPPKKDLTKKLLSLNFRYEGVRELLVGYLMGRGYDSDSFISFFHYHDREELLRRLPFDPTLFPQWDTIRSGIEKMQPALPLSIDVTEPKAMPAAQGGIPDILGGNHRRYSRIRDHFAPQSFLFAYCESRPFSPRAEISEKTVDALFSGKPFLPFAAPFFLQSLRDLGFKTFGDFWDESFDNIEDPAKRFKNYLTTLDSIASKTWPEIKELNTRLQPLVQYNLDWVRHHVSDQEAARLVQEAQA